MKQVQELVKSVAKDEICIALEYYDYDVERTVEAFLEGKPLNSNISRHGYMACYLVLLIA